MNLNDIVAESVRIMTVYGQGSHTCTVRINSYACVCACVCEQSKSLLGYGREALSLRCLLLSSLPGEHFIFNQTIKVISFENMMCFVFCFFFFHFLSKANCINFSFAVLHKYIPLAVRDSITNTICTIK